jgi:hypothetical protein
MTDLKPKVYTTTVPLYGLDIRYSGNLVALFDLFDHEHRDPESIGGAVIWADGRNDLGIWIPQENHTIEIPVLAHESFHAAMRIGDVVGLEPTMTANEEIAYLITWITGWVLDCVRADKKRYDKLIINKE